MKNLKQKIFFLNVWTKNVGVHYTHQNIVSPILYVAKIPFLSPIRGHQDMTPTIFIIYFTFPICPYKNTVLCMILKNRMTNNKPETSRDSPKLLQFLPYLPIFNQSNGPQKYFLLTVFNISSYLILISCCDFDNTKSSSQV